MSATTKIKIKCPNCGEEFEFNSFDSVNVTLHPELKEKVLNGDLFLAPCPKCGEKTFVMRPVLYHDSKAKLMIYVNTTASVLCFIEDMKKKNLTDEELPHLLDDYTLLGATSMADLCTMIVSIDNGYDWRIMQMMLLLSEYRFRKYRKENNMPEVCINYSYLSNNKDEDGNNIIILDIGEGEDNEQVTTSFKEQNYKSCKEQFGKRIEQIDPAIFDEDARNYFVSFFEEDFEKQEQNKLTYYYIQLLDGDSIICRLDPKMENTPFEDDEVIIQIGDNKRVGIVREIAEKNILCMPLEPNGIYRIVGIK